MNPANNFTTFLEQHKASGKKLIVAVSGGRDSMCLLHLCLSHRLTVVAAHCNFGLRQNESDEDEAFVSEYCRKNDIPYETIRFPTRNEAGRHGLSIQETARMLRYEWFEQLRLKHEAAYILTAHHANDSIETFIHHLARGSGLKGMTGIPEKNGFILRPLLSWLRKDIDSYTVSNGLEWRDDSSNEKDDYSRNYIRHHIVPGLVRINSNAEAHLLHTMSLVQETSGLVSDYASLLRERFISGTDTQFEIRLHELRKLSYCRTLLVHWLAPYGFNPAMIEEMIRSHTTGAGWKGHEGYTAVYNRGILELMPDPPENLYPVHRVDELPAKIRFGRHSYLLSGTDQLPETFAGNSLYLDASRITFPIILRQWKQGDAFIPLGMKNRKKLSDLFTDMHLGMNQKKECMVVESGGEIAAVAPYRISEKYKLSNLSKEAIVITLLD